MSGHLCSVPPGGSPSCRPHPPAEMKWVEMTSHWEKTMSPARCYKKVRGEWPHAEAPWLAPPLPGKIQPPVSQHLLASLLLLAETLARWQIVPEAS